MLAFAAVKFNVVSPAPSVFQLLFGKSYRILTAYAELAFPKIIPP